jgi:GLPGLI family protein
MLRVIVYYILIAALFFKNIIMKTPFLILLFSFFNFFNTVFSQTSVEKAYLLIKYEEKSINDTTDLQKINYDVMGLEIGKTYSKFYSISLAENRKALEEQMKKTGMVDLSQLSTPKNRRGKDRVIFKYTDTKQLTTFENLGIFNYSYSEPTPPIKWEVKSDTLRTLNYVCQKAVGQFRGRSYEAWFTPEINISEGPWKFTGLPGLILKVEESKGHYSFLCTGIEKIDRDILISNSKTQKVSREEYLKLRKQFNEDPLPFMSDGRNGFTLDGPPSNLPKRPYNPMELTEK